MNDKVDISLVLRLFPGMDLRTSIENFVQENDIVAGWIVTCVGSLTEYSIRYANQKETSSAPGYFEIVNLSGTISVNGCHMHIIVSDGEGKTIGGHLVEGCKIYTTVEIILIKSGNYIFERTTDSITPWKELQIKKR